MWFHAQESKQVGVLSAYEDLHPGASYLVEFSDGEAYVCAYDTEYESENSVDLDIERDDPRFDEFYQVVLLVSETRQGSARLYGRYLTLDYRDFPMRITNAHTGELIYPASPTETVEGSELRT